MVWSAEEWPCLLSPLCAAGESAEPLVVYISVSRESKFRRLSPSHAFSAWPVKQENQMTCKQERETEGGEDEEKLGCHVAESLITAESERVRE